MPALQPFVTPVTEDADGTLMQLAVELVSHAAQDFDHPLRRWPMACTGG